MILITTYLERVRICVFLSSCLQKIYFIMATTLRRVLVLMTILSLFNAKVFGKNTRPTRNDEIANIEEALQYLQELENFYDGKARIR